MLPVSSSPRRRSSAAMAPGSTKRSAAARWRRLALALVLAVLGLFFYMQYTILSTNIGGLAARARTFGGAAAHAKQGPAAIMRASNPTASASASSAPATREVHLRHNNNNNAFGFDALDHDAPAQQAPDTNAVAQTLASSRAPHVSALPAVAVSPAEQEKRRVAVVDAMRFAWASYEKHAFGADEVDPAFGHRKDNVWGNIACSLVDGMDTLFVMGLKDEFARAREYVATSLRFDHLGKDRNKISVFETIIREVGGLLSAFALSGDAVFKIKAQELMDLLVPAFHEAHGVFYTLFNPHTKERTFASWAGYRAHIADVGTLQLETRYLSDITGDPKYAKMGDAFYAILQREGSYNHTGLFPVHFDATAGKFATRSSITFGALGDSFYEYLLKVYVYSGQRREDAYLRALYDDAVAGLETHLLAYSAPDDLYYLRELNLPSLSGVDRMDHLLCFVPGMLALGTLYEPTDAAKNAKHLALAQKLMKTCYAMYATQPSGLSPDIVAFPHLRVRDPKYKLRPEAVESLFYLYRVTKDETYRQQGWAIFQAIETHAKLKFGYGAVKDVTQVPTRKDNKMESFFLAETLKYHYLLQAPDDVLPLDEFVFNTEAHPLRIQRNRTRT